mmetsp:Transcript_25804/g.45496  ORF Transcript_25804/g.45496 Transcript_25804/m.45496 type:complete len:237 (-) Transcript_25804:1976-2686(-)
MSFVRVDALDSLEFDSVCCNFLIDQWTKALLPLISYRARAISKAAVWAFHHLATLWRGRDTPGNELFNMAYSLSSKYKYLQLVVHLVVETLGALTELEDKRKLWVRVYSVLHSANLVAFYMTGTGRTLSERLSNIKLVQKQPGLKRQVDYNYIARLTMLQAFTDLFKVAFPLFAIDQLLNSLFRSINLGELSSSIKCEVCSTSSIVSPVRFSDCSHVFCYFCLASAGSSRCLKCSV